MPPLRVFGPASAQELRPPTIATIEQGLRPAVMLAGSPPPLRTLTAEMDRLHVPGVSIAVMHDGVIQWAKGYGVTRADGGPVTPTRCSRPGRSASRSPRWPPCGWSSGIGFPSTVTSTHG
ncbi:serine hydrolase [Sphingomonas sp. I4]